MKKTCIVITGPTAVGKTAVAIELAKHFCTSIISADSRQCYNEMNIGVAKPSDDQLREVKHYFINSHSVTDNVNAAEFEKYALGAAAEIFSINDIAIVVGGTGLYIKAFCEGLDEIPAVEPAIRQEITAMYQEKGLSWLQQEIKQQDPLFFADGEIQNPQRMMRALEVKRATGKSIREFQRGASAPRDFNIIKLGLELPRETLHRQINQRVDDMIRVGLVEEVRSLYDMREYNALQTVGYSEIIKYIDNEITLEEAVALIKGNTRQYAKRQITWFKRSGIEFFLDPRSSTNIFSDVEKKLQSILF